MPVFLPDIVIPDLTNPFLGIIIHNLSWIHEVFVLIRKRYKWYWLSKENIVFNKRKCVLELIASHNI